MSLIRCFCLIISFILIALLAGCSETSFLSQHFNPEKTLCTPAGAYQQGFEDGRRALGMRSNIADSCPSNNTAIQGSYRDGYIAGQNEQR
ncbi:MAG: hypothetical protein K0R12_729 [Gammaproteobacteria bacterium]|nr:hypothetical protein [Gammaproteobacteria bacterium]